jgi:hypothetical protein
MSQKEFPSSSKDRVGSQERSILAKLVNNRGFARGDMQIMQGESMGIIIKNIAISDANTSDKGKVHRVGEFFYIYNFPVKDTIAKDSSELNKPTIRERLVASPVLTEKDHISSVSDIPPAPLAASLKSLALSLLSRAKDAPTTCQLAPVTLKDAVKRLRSTGGGSTGDKYKSLPPNGEVIRDPETGERTFLGMHTEYDKEGNVSIASNNRGLLIDKNGKISTYGDLDLKESPSQPHGLIGMPTKRNALIEFQPNTFIMPAGLGPLALDRIPDFSMVNWAIKTMDAIEAIKDISKLIAEKKKTGKDVSQILEEKQKQRSNEISGKII